MIVHLCFLLDRLVNDIVLPGGFSRTRGPQILHAKMLLLQVDITQSAVEDRFAEMQFILEPKLGIVNGIVATKTCDGIIEISQCFFKFSKKEVRHSALKVRDC